jgi:hypothetical protein
VSSDPYIAILDVIDAASFDLLPPCADPRFDHRSCDYWEDEARGSKTARPSWWRPTDPPVTAASRRPAPDNPFAPSPETSPRFNPFSPAPGDSRPDLRSILATEPADEALAAAAFNPFAPQPRSESPTDATGPRKLRLLTRGRAVFGSFAKVLTLDRTPAAYAQFGPLSAYPRAQQIRDLYPQLPQSPLPAVITCVATTSMARSLGLGQRLIGAVTADLAGRGFAAAEAYPDLTLPSDEASAARPAFWAQCGFSLAVDDERYPVMRIELD